MNWALTNRLTIVTVCRSRIRYINWLKLSFLNISNGNWLNRVIIDHWLWSTRSYLSSSILHIHIFCILSSISIVSSITWCNNWIFSRCSPISSVVTHIPSQLWVIILMQIWHAWLLFSIFHIHISITTSFSVWSWLIIW